MGISTWLKSIIAAPTVSSKPSGTEATDFKVLLMDYKLACYVWKDMLADLQEHRPEAAEEFRKATEQLYALERQILTYGLGKP